MFVCKLTTPISEVYICTPDSASEAKVMKKTEPRKQESSEIESVRMALTAVKGIYTNIFLLSVYMSISLVLQHGRIRKFLDVRSDYESVF